MLLRRSEKNPSGGTRPRPSSRQICRRRCSCPGRIAAPGARAPCADSWLLARHKLSTSFAITLLLGAIAASMPSSICTGRRVSGESTSSAARQKRWRRCSSNSVAPIPYLARGQDAQGVDVLGQLAAQRARLARRAAACAPRSS
ncbi:MAG: hypothetical protein U1E76_21590 [Planctomycetota bacterium]